MRRTVLTFVLFIGAAFAPDASAGPLDPFVSIGCWSDQNNCGAGRGSVMLKSPLRLAVSPDGKTVYSSIGGGGIAWSTRDAATGAITPTGCIATSGCTVTSTVAGEATEIVVSPDGGNVYQATDGRLEVFDRDASTGALAYHECFNVSGDVQCTSVAGISTAYGVAISPDGANVYVASRDIAGGSGYLQAFTRGAGGHLTRRRVLQSERDVWSERRGARHRDRAARRRHARRHRRLRRRGAVARRHDRVVQPLRRRAHLRRLHGPAAVHD